MTAVASKSIINKEKLNQLLLSKGIKSEEHPYEFLKYPGASKGEDLFIASIMNFAYIDKVGTILLPYQRGKSSGEHASESSAESNLDFLRRTVEDQAGIVLQTQYSRKVYERKAPSMSDAGSTHTQVFYENFLPLEAVPDMKYFEGRRKEDGEKGRPESFDLFEAIEFLPTSNVAATLAFVESALRRETSPLFWKNPKSVKYYLEESRIICMDVLEQRNIEF